MFTFLHAADLHLDAPVASVTARHLPAATVEALRDASILAWDALVDTAIAHGVDFVVLSGGLYAGPEHGLRAQLCLRDGLARLDAAGIRSFVVLGHDDAAPPGWTAIDGWPAGTHVFGGSPPTGQPVESVTFEAGGETVTVHGVSNPARALPDDIVARFPTKPGRGFHLGVLHVGHGAGRLPLTELASRTIGYWALGGAHSPTIHAREPWIVEPGTIQGRNTDPTDRGGPGAYLVTVDGGRVVDPQPLAVDLVRFVTASVDITALQSVTELIDRFQAATDPGRHDGRSVVANLVVTGSGTLHDELVDPAKAAKVVKVLNAGAASSPFTWVDAIDWRTRPVIDLDEVRQGTDFLSDLLATADGSPGADDWRSLLPALPTDVARYLGDPIDPADGDITSRALDLALNEFAGGQA
jgi:DNA repair exonuclease SbcCD nuclease subunit